MVAIACIFGFGKMPFLFMSKICSSWGDRILLESTFKQFLGKNEPDGH